MNKEVNGLTPLAMQKLMLYDWPGNVRELENTMEYAVAMTQQDIISEDLIFQQQNKAIISPQPSLPPLKEARNAYEKNYLIQILSICKGNISKAANLAGKYRADFYELLKKHDLNIKDFKKSK